MHFSFGQDTGWLQLGALSNSKPSAIFRLKGAVRSSVSGFQTSDTGIATLGILCQELQAIESHLLSNSQLVPRSSISASTEDAIRLVMLLKHGAHF